MSLKKGLLISTKCQPTNYKQIPITKFQTELFHSFEIGIWNYMENNPFIPSPLAGEGWGEGEQAMTNPTN